MNWLAPFRVVAFLWVAIALCHPAAANEPDATRVQAIANWLTPEPSAAGESITNRAAWETLAKRPEFARQVAKARDYANVPIPAQPEDLFLDYSRTGNRDHWQDVAFVRRGMISTYVFAECIENNGQFLTPLEKLIASLCEEPTWVYPAHDGELKNFRQQTVDIDLGSAMLGWELATADRILGDRLSPATRQLVHANLERRIFVPYRACVRGERKEFWWMSSGMNWNAVCHAGVAGAALAALQEPQERAWFIAAVEERIQRFLEGFTPDGYCSEGVGYWNYGFGHFVLLSETIRRNTGGKVDWLTNPKAVNPALFGARTEILAGIYPSIADCSPGSRPADDLMALLAPRFGFAAHVVSPSRTHWLYDTLTYATAAPGTPTPVQSDGLVEMQWRTWLPNGGVLICRPGSTNGTPFAACLKGGHNDEDHNHNDVGTFMVVVGRTMLLCDPGAEVYTKRTFSARRYDSKVLSSFGHPVPLIAGRLQRTGAQARGEVLQTRFTPGEDRLKLDIRSAYDVPELKRLERDFVFTRGASPSLTVTDEIEFSQPATYETALITWGKWERNGENELLIQDGPDAVRVQINSGGVPFDVRGDTLDENVPTPRQPIRISLQLKSPITAGQIRLAITPAK